MPLSVYLFHRLHGHVAGRGYVGDDIRDAWVLRKGGVGGLELLAGLVEGRGFYRAILGSQATCGVLTGLMATRWFRGGKFMPAGLLACLSFAMVAFYGLCMRIQKPKKVKAG